MLADVMTLNHTSPDYTRQLEKQAKNQKAQETFLGHVLSTLLEEMVPKEGHLADPNSQLFFSMYFDELMQTPEMIKSMGLGGELNG